MVHREFGDFDNSADDARVTCERAIAFVTAFQTNDRGDAPDIEAVLMTARQTGVPAAIVLAAPSFAEAAVEAVRRMPRKGRTMIQAAECDPTVVAAMEAPAKTSEVNGLPYGLLATMRAISEYLLDGYDAVLVLDAAQDGVSADDLCSLCLIAQNDATGEVFSLDAEQRGNYPCLVKRSLLDQIEMPGSPF